MVTSVLLQPWKDKSNRLSLHYLANYKWNIKITFRKNNEIQTWEKMETT